MGNALRSLIPLEPAANIESIHARHHYFQEDEIGDNVGLAYDPESFLTTGRHGDSISFRLQQRLQQLQVGRHIIDQEDSRARTSVVSVFMVDAPAGPNSSRCSLF